MRTCEGPRGQAEESKLGQMDGTCHNDKPCVRRTSFHNEVDPTHRGDVKTTEHGNHSFHLKSNDRNTHHASEGSRTDTGEERPKKEWSFILGRTSASSMSARTTLLALGATDKVNNNLLRHVDILRLTTQIFP